MRPAASQRCGHLLSAFENKVHPRGFTCAAHRLRQRCAAARGAGGRGKQVRRRDGLLALLEDSAFSDEFCRFIQTAVSSVDAAELLLVLSREPERWWNAAELAARLRPGDQPERGGRGALRRAVPGR